VNTVSADVVIVGCGGAGSAAVAELSRRGRRVVAFDAFGPRHDRGSSHGTERIARAAYTDEAYVSMALDSFEGWRALERETNSRLLSMVGSIDTGFVRELADISANLAAHGVPHEMLDTAEAEERFPFFRFEHPVLWQPNSGTVHAEAAVSAFQRVARSNGADLRFDDAVESIDVRAEGVLVRSRSTAVEATSVIVTAGAWADRLLSGMLLLPELIVTDEQVFFYRPRADHPWPTFITRTVPELYGLPTPGGLMKAGEHYSGPRVDPDVREAPSALAAGRVSEWIAEFVPGLEPVPVKATTCLYASFPDEDFIIDRVGDVVIGVGLGGHGFKFLPEVGRRLADLADGEPWLANPFAIDRMPRHVGPSGHK
jgi:sarcosine oxidase